MIFFSIRRFYGTHLGVSPFKIQFRLTSSEIGTFISFDTFVSERERKRELQFRYEIVLNSFNDNIILWKIKCTLKQAHSLSSKVLHSYEPLQVWLFKRC